MTQALHRLGSLAAAALVSVTLLGTAVPTAGAATQDWGPQGSTETDSAVTVRWDNAGNPAEDTVPRDSTQVIPNTGGKTYTDVREAVRTRWAQVFGDLTMTVGQTTNLVNQGVTVTFTGLPPSRTSSGTATDDNPSIELFQCWGAPGSDGKPDPDATEPDPRSCFEGAGGPDAGAGVHPFRSLNGDPLAEGYVQATGRSQLELLAIDGTVTPAADLDQVITASTTNEHSKVQSGMGTTAVRTFEMYTGVESSYLGCGARDDGVASTPTCWLVAVPMTTSYGLPSFGGEGGMASGLTPSFWAQRLQVKLDFAPAQQVCVGDMERILAAGSELATGAMASWVPGLCADAGIATGYSQLSDDTARRQLDAGVSPFVLTSRAATGAATYVPAALPGVVIGLTLDYQPPWGDPERAPQAGKPVTDLKLNARLVAKLLTQSYVDGGSIGTMAAKLPNPWFRYTKELLTDQEFLTLNPDLHFSSIGAGVTRLEVESLKSDAAAALWDWILADPEARAFLDGCPDPYHFTVNPWYSTRTYAQCPEQAEDLEAAAAAERDATATAPGFARSTVQTYPPPYTPYPQVLYAQSDAESDGRDYVGPATWVDLYPPQNDQLTLARNAARGVRVRGQWCNEFVGGCNVPQWKGTSLKQPIGQRAVFVVADTASAARFQIQTAQLCATSDTTGEHCVGATSSSLTNQASRYTSTSIGAPLTAPPEPDYAGGAYPLLTPVYAVVRRDTLGDADARRDGDILRYLTTKGQAPGTGSGRLPYGYAPLTGAFVSQADAGIAALRMPAPAPTASAPPPASVPVAPSSTGPASAPAIVPPVVAPPAPAPTSSGGPVVTTSGAGVAGTTPTTSTGFPQYGVVTGVLGAAAAGAAAPILGRRRRVLGEE